MSFPYIPLYCGDYLRDTSHLTLEQHGAYILLIMAYWTKGGLPHDDAQLARIVGVSPSKWTKLKPVLKSFFNGTGWQHKRIDAELYRSQEKSRTNAEKARNAANARWAEAESDPF